MLLGLTSILRKIVVVAALAIRDRMEEHCRR
uniref:Uncharacterized protein n=1 Tax=Arundo donax TaxID=35708 RepID=A0A0A9B9H9_ARUDO